TLSAGPIRILGGAPRFEGGTIAGSPTELVRLEAGAVEIAGAALSDAGASGIRGMPGTTLVLRNSTVQGTAGYGVILEPGSSATIEDNLFTDTTDYALRAKGATIALRRNEMHHHCAAFLIDGTTGVVEGNSFFADGHGLSLRRSGAIVVSGNLFEGANDALTLLSANATVTNNTFRATDTGVLLYNASGAFEGNVFEANAHAFRVGLASGTSAPVLRNNSFAGNTVYALQNEQVATIDARYNWWNSTLGPNAFGAETVIGAVDFASFLLAAP
ncbi:MAG: right-handed parallel beta-helix repeat-containing protein, partial [Methanobacteriota archaeon]